MLKRWNQWRASAVSASALALLIAAPAFAAPTLSKIDVYPSEMVLTGKDTVQRLMVIATYSDGSQKDVTGQAKFSNGGTTKFRLIGNKVSSSINGEAPVTASFGGKTGQAKVTVREADLQRSWSFANDIVPIFTKYGCNTGGCHGSPAGRGGFRLSLFGYEPDYDFDQVTKDQDGKRVNLQIPAKSLILLKPTLQIPHGGGPRFKTEDADYKLIQAWVKAGAPQKPEFDRRVKSIKVYPESWVLREVGDEQQVMVIAHFDDGATRDVTEFSRFHTYDDTVIYCDEEGLLSAEGKGETTVNVRFLAGVGVVRLQVPRDPLPAAAFAGFKPLNRIDELVLAKLKQSQVGPSPLASDSEFVRRVYLDICGIIPTSDETRKFLADKDPNKRSKVIDQLLTRPEYVEFWTLKWADLLNNTADQKENKGVQTFYRWIRDSIGHNKPYNQFVYEMLTASGSGYRNGPVNWYMNGQFGGDYAILMASSTSQAFLGIRIDCARCHNHAFEAWSQMDYYGFAAFFARTRTKTGTQEDERIIFPATTGEVNFPRTGERVQARYLGGDVVTFRPNEDRRIRMAKWLTSSNNPWFRKNITNRIWRHLVGIGLSDPVDDLRATNPAANEPLWDYLAESLLAKKYDLKDFMREVLNSRTYQTSSSFNNSNVGDRKLFSHRLPRRMYAEVLLDAIIKVTNVPQKFGPYPVGTRAIAVPDNTINNGFLDLFGRASRSVTCECERTEEVNVTMVLNLLNGGTLNNRISNPNGRVARLIKANTPPDKIMEELYLAVLARYPNAKDKEAAQKLFAAAANPQEAGEDLLWGLLNTREFVFNH